MLEGGVHGQEKGFTPLCLVTRQNMTWLWINGISSLTSRLLLTMFRRPALIASLFSTWKITTRSTQRKPDKSFPFILIFSPVDSRKIQFTSARYRVTPSCDDGSDGVPFYRLKVVSGGFEMSSQRNCVRNLHDIFP